MDIEERARQMGWTDQEEFKGNPNNWVDAETFVERAETSLPIAKGTIKRLESEISDLKKSMKEFSEFHRATAEREYQKALATLKKQQIDAVEEGDKDKFHEAQAEIDEIIKQHPAAGGQPKSNNDAQEALRQWIADNPWYSEDDEMADYAHRMDQRLRNLRPDLSPRDHLAQLTEKVRNRFPDKFGGANDRRKEPAVVMAGDNTATIRNDGKRSYGNLPSEAKALCDKWVKEGWMTKEQFLKDYQWE